MARDEGRQRAVRSDAQRNREAIRSAAVARLMVDSRASMAQIAAAAGVERVTLYGHFPTRAALVSEVFRRHVEQADAALDALDRGQAPAQILANLISSSWEIMAEADALIAAAESELGARAVREFHDGLLARVASIIEDGVEQGAFATAQPVPWLTECFFALLHGAAAGVREGRFTPAVAATELTTTVLALVRSR